MAAVDMGYLNSCSTLHSLSTRLCAICLKCNFRKLKLALNPMYRIVLNFAKSYILPCLSEFCNKKKIHRAVFEI